MNCKTKIIILLVLIIVIIISNNFYENFSADPKCMGLAVPIGTATCGNYKVNGGYCVPNPNDCFNDPVTSEHKCWCKTSK